MIILVFFFNRVVHFVFFDPQDKVLYTYGASEDTVALETLPVLGWTLDALSDVSRKSSDN
jgi:hypothetical protein